MPHLLLILLAGVAQAAGTAVWLVGEPDPTVTPQLLPLSAAEAAPDQRWTETDERAVARLAEEVEAARPLLDTFDGELDVLRRMAAALADVHALRKADRDVVWRALALQGTAAARYFVEDLATDPAAEPYRVAFGQRWEVGPWLDAIALDPDRRPTIADIPDENLILAYNELKARALLVAPATVEVVGLPAGGRLVVDGRVATAARTEVPAGLHRIAVEVDGGIRSRHELRLSDGDHVVLGVMASAVDLAAYGDTLRQGPAAAQLPEEIGHRLDSLQPPVQLVVAARRHLYRYGREGDQVTLIADSRTRPRGRSGPSLAVAAGGGWLYDGDYYLQNAARGAPDERAAVNAATPVASVAGTLPVGALVAGLGVDLVVSFGEWHELPRGDARLRSRFFPHLRVGLPAVQLAAGLFTPWQVGVGPRVTLPLPGSRMFHVTGSYTYSYGLTVARDGDEPAFEASPVHLAWAGLALSLPR